jgi:hypothetical protein
MGREIGFISDACTLPGYVAASPGLHVALRFQYRPATISERVQLAAPGQDAPSQGFAHRTAALLAQRLVSWELPDAAVQQPVSAQSVLALQPQLFEKLHHVVLGYVASDIDPAWPAEVGAEVLRDRAHAESSGRTPGETADERREKN